MGTSTLDILRQGIWASLTGGWFYDPNQSIFCNTFHLYLWIFLFIYPFCLFMFFSDVSYIWAVYVSVISIVFVIIKLTNYSLHIMFDNATKIEEPIDQDDETGSQTENENALPVPPPAPAPQNSQTTLKILNFGEPSNQDESEENQDQCIEMKVIKQPPMTRSTTLTLEQILNEPSTSRGPLSRGRCPRDEFLISLTKRLSKVMRPDDLNRELRRVTSFTCHPMLSSTFSDHSIAGPSHANEDYQKPIIPSYMANDTARHRHVKDIFEQIVDTAPENRKNLEILMIKQNSSSSVSSDPDTKKSQPQPPVTSSRSTTSSHSSSSSSISSSLSDFEENNYADDDDDGGDADADDDDDDEDENVQNSKSPLLVNRQKSTSSTSSVFSLDWLFHTTDPVDIPTSGSNNKQTVSPSSTSSTSVTELAMVKYLPKKEAQVAVPKKRKIKKLTNSSQQRRARDRFKRLEQQPSCVVRRGPGTSTIYRFHNNRHGLWPAYYLNTDMSRNSTAIDQPHERIPTPYSSQLTISLDMSLDCIRLQTTSTTTNPNVMNDTHSDISNIIPVTPHTCSATRAITIGSNRNLAASKSARYHFAPAKTYYKYHIIKPLPFFIKIHMDRLQLMSLLDRNLTLFETVLSILLAVAVAVFATIQLHIKKFHKDINALLFCFVTAGAHYSLFKSVQPDAASPTHGFNRTIAYSRSIYFCIFSVLILLTNTLQNNFYVQSPVPLMTIYHVEINDSTIESFMATIEYFFTMILFCFPVIFSFGLLPQINTFIMYLIEQIDMHIFGASAMANLTAAFFSLFRSLIVAVCLFGFALGAFSESKSGQHILFSLFLGFTVAICYHLSRNVSDPVILWAIIKEQMWPPFIYDGEKGAKNDDNGDNGDDCDDSGATKVYSKDPLPEKLKKSVLERLKSDIIMCSFISAVFTGLHMNSVFAILSKHVIMVQVPVIVTVGFLLHYLIPQLRKQIPWKCLAHPILVTKEHSLFEVRNLARVMWFEKIVIVFGFVERNILYPIFLATIISTDAPLLVDKYNLVFGVFLVVICALKLVRSCYARPQNQFLILIFTVLFSLYDFQISETMLLDYFVMAIVFDKVCELMLKMNFVVTYSAPWQITWGSACHAVTQPFSVPHSTFLLAQVVIASILSAPLNPFLGSAMFFISYVRPVRFWERSYNTKRVDHSNSSLSSHLERNLGSDDNNLNSIFYEHLSRSLQHSLCGDLLMGRWGKVVQGDCFVLASDYLNCLVHIIEMGNGFVTFQLRGLEFRGTYCQQRELEAIMDNVGEDDTCCCCQPNLFPHILNINTCFNLKWLAWEPVASKYILEGYSISDNSAVSMLQVYDFRRLLISYYVKAIIFYLIRSKNLLHWLNLHRYSFLQMDRHFVDLDPVFNINLDEDYDFRLCGITRLSFCRIYLNWISFCFMKLNETQAEEVLIDYDQDSTLVSLCFALSLLGRRALVTNVHNSVVNVEVFLYGLHALFKGDFRISCPRDEWIFADMKLLETVVVPAVRMCLKLHQDHFMSAEEYDDNSTLYQAISDHEKNIIISHEGDPLWRNAILSGANSLLALRHVVDECLDNEYKIIMLNKRFLNFRVIKLNRECVRGLWSGQQQELIFLRNRNPERGSIQNAKQILRNIINSSCDQPIGYPIYVSPLTTSYADTNQQLSNIIGGPLSFFAMKKIVFDFVEKTRQRLVTGCSSNAGQNSIRSHSEAGPTNDIHMQTLNSTTSRMMVTKTASSTLVNIANVFKDENSQQQQTVIQPPQSQSQSQTRVKIIDPNVVFDCLNMGRRIDVQWPDEQWRAQGGRSSWKDWVPEIGMEGVVVHRWVPFHRESQKRSHVDKTILLVKIDDKFVPIAENGIQAMSVDEVFV